MDGAPFGIIILLTLLLMPWLTRARKGTTAEWTVPALACEIDRLETLLLRNELAFAASSLTQIDPHVTRLRGPDGARLRARLQLCAGHFHAAADQAQAVDSRLREMAG